MILSFGFLVMGGIPEDRHVIDNKAIAIRIGLLAATREDVHLIHVEAEADADGLIHILGNK